MATRVALAVCLAALLATCAACGGGSDAATPTTSSADNQLETLLAKTGMSVCADFGGGEGRSRCTRYSAFKVDCADTTHALDGLDYRRCEIQYASSVDQRLDPVCAALAPSDPQGYAVKPLDVCT